VGRKNYLSSENRRIHHKDDENGSFTCAHCGAVIPLRAFGTENRNHCPLCLWSLHVDITPGDRLCPCRGPMEPISIWVKDDGEWAIIHRCKSCGTLKSNRIAGDDIEKNILELADRPSNSDFYLTLDDGSEDES